MKLGHVTSTFTLAALILCANCATVSRGPELPGINQNRASTYRLDVLPSGHGSGVVISRDGYIVTAKHVAAAATNGLEILIDEGNGQPTAYRAEVVALDPVHDIAIVKIDRRFDRPALLEDMANINPGDAVYNVGYPYDFGEMVGRGSIQKLHFSYRDEDTGELAVNDAILVDVPDGPGTSGSGVFLARSGRLIGIMSMTFWASNGQPPTVTRVLVSVEHVKELLRANRIDFARADDRPTGNARTATVSDTQRWSITINAVADGD